MYLPVIQGDCMLPLIILNVIGDRGMSLPDALSKLGVMTSYAQCGRVLDGDRAYRDCRKCCLYQRRSIVSHFQLLFGFPRQRFLSFGIVRDGRESLEPFCTRNVPVPLTALIPSFIHMPRSVRAQADGPVPRS